jgi:hypothetical protein
MELIKDQHKSPALLRYADRITENRFDSNGGFNLAGGIADARWVFFLSSFPSHFVRLSRLPSFLTTVSLLDCLLDLGGVSCPGAVAAFSRLHR